MDVRNQALFTSLLVAAGTSLALADTITLAQVQAGKLTHNIY